MFNVDKIKTKQYVRLEMYAFGKVRSIKSTRNSYLIFSSNYA